MNSRKNIRVLVACEFSGRVRSAFRRRGFDAWSCDLLPAEDGSPYHIEGDVLRVLNNGWDLMIAHPPCTYLCNSGVRWLHERPDRWQKFEEAVDFFLTLWNAPIEYIAIENPVMHKYARERIGPPSQYIQPYEFGEPVSKKTGLWLKNLPPLMPTEIFPREKAKQMIWLMPPSSDRPKRRSVTFRGIAEAMAEQWGSFILKEKGLHEQAGICYKVWEKSKG